MGVTMTDRAVSVARTGIGATTGRSAGRDGLRSGRASSQTAFRARAPLRASAHRRRPPRIATDHGEDPVEQRGVVRHRRAAGPNASPRWSSVPGPREHGGELLHAAQRRVVDGERLRRGARQVPAVHDDLVEGDEPADLAGHLDGPGLGHARPRRRVLPGDGERLDGGGDPIPPVVAEPRAVTGRRVVGHRQRFLGRRPRERCGEATDVVEQVGDAVVRARRRVVELLVGDAAHEGGELAGRPGRGR